MKRLKKIIEGNKNLSWIFIFTNWFYQGIPQSDKTEKIYKISFTIFWGGMFSFLFVKANHINNLEFNLILGLISSHTLNWLVNNNLSVIFVHRIKWLKISKKRLFNHLYSIQRRLQNKNWILFAISLGGISRGTMSVHSDIDVNIIRKPGTLNGIYAVLFAAIERKRADFHGVPLDIIISDSFEDCIVKTDGQKNPVIMYDSNEMISKYYKDKMTIKEAQKFNNAYEK